jgi:hypothetical protein
VPFGGAGSARHAEDGTARSLEHEAAEAGVEQAHRLDRDVRELARTGRRCGLDS